MNYFIRVFTIIILLFLVGCRQTNNNGIPYVQVNIKLYTTDPAFFNLNAVGGWEYINGGSKGILVYRSGIDEFKAYDRHCPYQPSDACSKVAVDEGRSRREVRWVRPARKARKKMPQVASSLQSVPL